MKDEVLQEVLSLPLDEKLSASLSLSISLSTRFCSFSIEEKKLNQLNEGTGGRFEDSETGTVVTLDKCQIGSWKRSD